MKKLIIVGGRGNGSTIACAVEDINEEEPTWELLGFFNDSDRVGTMINDYPVVGRPQDMIERRYDDVHFIYSPLLAMPYARPNAERLEEFGLPPERFATVIHPSASVSRHAKIGFGAAIMPMCHVRQNVRIGNHVTMLLASAIGHDSSVADYSYLAGNSFATAYVKLEKGAYLGANACVRERITLGEWCLVGIGAVVIKDVPSMAVVAGNPAKFLRERTFETFKPKE